MTRRMKSRSRLSRAVLKRLITLGSESRQPNRLLSALVRFDQDMPGLQATLNQSL